MLYDSGCDIHYDIIAEDNHITEIIQALANYDIELVITIFDLKKDNEDSDNAKHSINSLLTNLENNNYMCDETLHYHYDYETIDNVYQRPIMWTWEDYRKIK